MNAIAQIESEKTPQCAERQETHEAPGLDDVLLTGKTHKYAPKFAIPVAPLCRVQSGMVQVFHVGEDGTRLSLGLRMPGDFFGTALSGQAIEAKAYLESEVMAWKWEALEGLEIGKELLEAVLREREHIVRRLVRQHLSCFAALGQLLIDLVEQQHGECLLPPFTHEWLARELGTTREIVTTAAIKYRELRAIQYDRKHILVDVEAVKHAMKLTQSAKTGNRRNG